MPVLKSQDPKTPLLKVDPKRISNRTSRSSSIARKVSAHWSERTPKELPAAVWPLVLSSVSSCLSADLPHGFDDAIQKIASAKDLRGLIDMRTQFSGPTTYGSAQEYFAAQIVLNLFAKTKLSVPGLDPLSKGVDRFFEAERLCRITNKRLRHYRSFDFSGRPQVERLSVHEVFHLARRKIQSWLGPLEVEKVLDGARHGPGGVVGLKRPSTTPYFKLANSKMSCSTGAYWYAVRSIASCDAWIRALAISEGLISNESGYSASCVPFETKIRLADKSITITDYNEVTFVDKDATTKRSISIEPQLSVYLQLAVGGHLKKVLASAGCNLSDQARNQELAHVGSVQQDLHDPVTLDLRMASDCLATELVRELLPREWFDFLDSLRSRYGSFRGETFEWAKFSSMGNGFTFELESMIFYALAQACSDLSGETFWFSDTFGPAFKYAYVSVFGDDLVVPKSMVSHFSHILRFCGFRLNSDKSFVEGPFRESCGKDFWDGVDVRTFYLKRDLSRVRDLIHLHNGLKNMNERVGDRLKPVLHLIRSMIPIDVERHLRGSTPTWGDAYIWVEPDETMTSKLALWDINWQRWVLPFMRLRAVEGKGTLHWKYVQFLYANTETRVPNERLTGELALFCGSDIPMKLSPLDYHFLGGGSRGNIVLSGEGLPSICWA